MHPIYIRHGESLRNKSKKQAKSEEEMQVYLKSKLNLDCMDCGLSSKGIQQCLETKQILKDHQIEVVIVSPMRRALLTCDIIFKDHPCNPKIIVQPLLTEKIHSASNLGTQVIDSKVMFPSFDFSKLSGKQIDWYVHLLQQEKRTRIMKMVLDNNCVTGEDVGRVILNQQKQNIHHLQTIQDAKKRALQIIKLFQSYFQKYSGKFAMVGHSKIMKILCNQERTPNTVLYENGKPMYYNVTKKQVISFN